MVKRTGGVPTDILIVNACLSAITLAVGVAAGAAVFGGVGLDPASAVLAIGCTIALHATFFTAAIGTRVRPATKPEAEPEPKTFGDWKVVAFDDLGRVVDRSAFRDAMGEPGAGQTDVQVPDILVVARGTALPVADELDPTRMRRPDLPEAVDEYRVYEVGDKSVGEVLTAWDHADHCATFTNGRFWFHDAPTTEPRSYIIP